jgi:hypothetical protein
VAVLVAAVVMVGCSAAPEGASAPEEEPVTGAATGDYASDVLTTDYEGALPVGTQLALGSLLLADTDDAITSEQAAVLLPLWQALQGGVTATAEVNAVLRRIEGTMTVDQLSEIAAMQLTQQGMMTWAREQGMGFPAGRGAGEGDPLSEDERATRQAEFAEGGGGFRGEGGEVPPEMATRRAEFQGMSDEERQEAIATMRAEGGGFGRAPGGAGPTGGGGGPASVVFLLSPLIEMLEDLAAAP